MEQNPSAKDKAAKDICRFFLINLQWPSGENAVSRITVEARDEREAVEKVRKTYDGKQVIPTVLTVKQID